MPMRQVFGEQPTTKPEGALRQIVFPSLATMDEPTGDGRILDSDGKGVRDLPRTIYAQFVQSFGHEGSVAVGALHEVVFEEDGNVSGRGWLIDDDNGRAAVRHVKTQSLRHNSVDLAETKVRFEWEPDDDYDEIMLRFTQWKIAATTLVGKPAFANAAAELLADDDLVASWYEEDAPLIIDTPTVVGIGMVADEEIVADGSAKPKWDFFHIPEADQPTKFTVRAEEDGWLLAWGHLALWESCHDGVEGRCTRVPRPTDGYASFNQPGVLTDRGIVETGPVFLAGGHKIPSDGDYYSAYGGIENTWADVRVVPGRHGPWMCGVVRPGVSQDKAYAAAASRVSGHWKGDRLKAVVSVNAEGFEVPGSGSARDVEFEFSLDENGRVSDLVASLPACVEADDGPERPEGDASDDSGDSSSDETTEDLTLLAAQAHAELDLLEIHEED